MLKTKQNNTTKLKQITLTVSMWENKSCGMDDLEIKML